MKIPTKKDTLWIMGLTNEFNEGRKWVQESFKFNSKTDVSVFETVIRFVGGFIAGLLPFMSIPHCAWSMIESFVHESHTMNLLFW